MQRKLVLAASLLALVLLAGCASSGASEPQYKDLRRLIPADADAQIEKLELPISLEGGISGYPAILTMRAKEHSDNYSCRRMMMKLLLLPQDDYPSIEFQCYKGCEDADCIDPDHYHWCVFNCDEPDHYHNFTPSKGCEDVLCTDPDHYHWCPYGCKEPEHGHLPYQWKYFE